LSQKTCLKRQSLVSSHRAEDYRLFESLHVDEGEDEVNQGAILRIIFGSEDFLFSD
jgi:hypothetical protein